MHDTVFYTIFPVRILHPLPNEKPRNHNGSEVFSLFPRAAGMLFCFILRKDHAPRAPFGTQNAHQNANRNASDFRPEGLLKRTLYECRRRAACFLCGSGSDAGGSIKRQGAAATAANTRICSGMLDAALHIMKKPPHTGRQQTIHQSQLDFRFCSSLLTFEAFPKNRFRFRPGQSQTEFQEGDYSSKPPCWDLHISCSSPPRIVCPFHRI